MEDRFERQIRLFGRDGQARLSATRVAIVGIGGLGTHVVQQLALLGVGGFALIDSEELDSTNLNRYVGARYDDPIPGTLKVGIGERIVYDIDPTIPVEGIHDSLVSDRAFQAVIAADYVFGCLDSEGARLVLNELCAAYARPLLDLASDVIPGSPVTYGGRVCVSIDGQGCIVCWGLLEVAEAQADLAGEGDRRNREALYGVERAALGRSGPSVVSINGVVASLAVTEFMVSVTGLRLPKRVLAFRGHMGRVSGPTVEVPAAGCYYCKGIYGRGDAADVQRYIRAGIGRTLR